MSPALASPDLFPFALEGDDLRLVAMDRAAYRRSLFLDGRISTAGDAELRIAVAEVDRPPATGWIFHVAHCGSTLLARALDRDGGGLVLREPFALRQLGLDAPSDRRSARIETVARLLGRRYADAPATIVKGNVPVNFILPELLEHRRDDPAVLLYHALPAYLAAILRSPNHRAWARGITEALAPAIVALAGPLPDDDAGRAALLWLAQMRRFAGVLARCPDSASLDADLFFARPAAVIDAAARHFHQPMAPGEAAAIAAGPLFATYSKQPDFAFTETQRAARQADLLHALAPEIARAEDLVTKRGGFAGLARPLVGAGAA